MVKMLLENEYSVSVIDNLSSGHRDAVPADIFTEGDIRDTDFLAAVFRQCEYDAVMDFAAYIDVAESIRNPSKYYENNLGAKLILVKQMLRSGVNKLIFSSSAAVYGNTSEFPIKENDQKNPMSPYGRSKWMTEQILQDYSDSQGLRVVSLRYFNCAGADPSGTLRERHNPETHLIPILLQAAAGNNHNIQINGSNYSTPDGTCIRDYVHVRDICRGHLHALTHLLSDSPSGVFNLGSGSGASVLDVIHAVEEVTGRKLMYSYTDRRNGDPAVLVADISAANLVLNWSPILSDLNTIIMHAWAALPERHRRTH
jgi:UDP-glucose 4-epimerase